MRKPPAIGELRHRGLEDLAAVLKGAKLIEAGAGRREDNRISGARQVHGRGEPRVQGLHTGHGAGIPKRRGEGGRASAPNRKAWRSPVTAGRKGERSAPLAKPPARSTTLSRGPNPLRAATVAPTFVAFESFT